MELKKNLIKTIEFLVKTIPKDVEWGFSDGTAAFFYGSGREPTDLDICTDNYGIQKITETLNEFLLKPAEKISKDFFEAYVAKFRVNEYEIEVYSESFIKIAGKIYPKSIDEEQLKRIRKIRINNIEIPLLSPEDVIASKALTQRGKEVGKHDIDDVKAILKNQKIEWKYLKERAKRMKGYDRIFGLFKYLGYQIQI
jgi:hypothetical protein